MNPWRQFVAAAVARYKPGGSSGPTTPGFRPMPPHVWQVYNEQNITAFWPTGPSANKYGVLLHATAETIRACRPEREDHARGDARRRRAMNGTPSISSSTALP